MIAEKFTYTLSVAMMSAASGTAARLGENESAIILVIVSGISAIVGAMYYRANDDEGIATDLFITIIAAFLVGVSLGGPLGQWVANQAEARFEIILPGYSIHIIGGGLAGGIFTPLVRTIMDGGAGRFFSAIQQFVKTLKGGKK